MTAKTYTEKGNCARAAKAALGKTAKVLKDFVINEHVEGDKKSYSWSRVGPPKTAGGKRRPKGDSPPLHLQPQMVKLVRYCERKSGATIEFLAANLGRDGKAINPETVRGSISRIQKEGHVSFLKVRDGRTLTYFVNAPADVVAAAAEAATEANA